MNLALQKSLNHQDLLPLHGKRVLIRVRDIGLQLHFTVANNGFQPIAKTGHADLTITASIHDFYLLATRQEDPDALFFNRRLLIEGDTELGLVAKNTLDGIELPKPTLAILSPKNMLAWAKASKVVM
ncbi:MAG: SCP2 sterol-binding domain-containing protein [Nitrosomonadales bacterium]|nr:SCP2 sterol-binding domain-containing protein [Nitrosomonadales bacterium]